MEGDKKSLLRDKQFIIGALGGIAIVAALGFVIWLIYLEFQATAVTEQNNAAKSAAAAATPLETAPVTNLAINTFEMKKDAEICREDGKPVIYLFSTATCPHCQWIKDTYDRVVKEYVATGKIKAYHYDVDSGDDLLTPAKETQLTDAANKIYNEFSPEGYIPTFVFGCKYFRVGNGYESESDLAKEETEFRAVIDDLLKNN